MLRSLFLSLSMALLLPAAAFAQAAVQLHTGTPATPVSATNPLQVKAQDLAPPLTFQGTMSLSATTSTSLIAANVTMAPNSAALPAAGAFTKLVVIAPGSNCSFTVNWQGGTASATSGEQFGGTNLSSDTVNLTGVAAAPTFYSTAGCSSPALVQFHN